MFPTQSVCLRVLDKMVIVSSSNMLYNAVERVLVHFVLLFPNNALIVRGCFLCFCSLLYSISSKFSVNAPWA